MSKTTIEYKGVVTNVEPGHSAVIRCDSRKMQDEVVVTAGQGGGGGITPTGTLNITKNGTYDVTEYASVNANVPTTEVKGDGRPIEVTTEEEFEAIVASPAENLGKIYNYMGNLFTIVQESDA